MFEYGMSGRTRSRSASSISAIESKETDFISFSVSVSFMYSERDRRPERSSPFFDRLSASFERTLGFSSGARLTTSETS